MPMYSPGGQPIPEGLTGYGLQLWQSGYFDPPAQAPAAPAPAAGQFKYDLTPLGQSMNGGATQVAAAPMAPQPVSNANAPAVSGPAQAPRPSSADAYNDIFNLYHQYLGRDPEGGNNNFWVQNLVNGAASLQDTQTMIAQAGKDAGIAPTGGASPYGGQYNFDHSLLNSTMQPEWMNQASLANGMAPNDMAGRWQRFNDATGNPMVAAPQYGAPTWDGEGQQRQYTQGPLTGWQVLPDPGDMGGGWLGAGHESAAMNGRKYDSYDAQGNYTGNGTISNWQDDFLGPAGALAVLAMPFAAAGLGAGAAGAAGAGASAAAGGSLASEMAALGAGGAAAAGGAGAGAAAAAAAEVAAAGGGLAAGSTGTGLSLSGGGLGLTGATGSGLSLAGGGGVGLTGASAGSGAIGAGLGGGLAGGTGTLLGPAALAGAGGAAGAALGVGAGSTASGAAGSIFNPAVDSQLASTQLGITGAQAGADAAAAAIPSVTVNGAPTGSWLSNLTASGGAVPGTGDVGGGTLGSLGSAASGAGSLIPGVSNSSLLGSATTALGGLAGSQSGSGSGSGGSGGTLDPRMEPYLYGSGGLLQQTQNTLNQQQPLAQAQSAQLASTGSGLLNRPISGNGYGNVGTNVAPNGYGAVGGPVAGNGFGQVQMADANSFMNPYYGGMADDMQRRTASLLGQNNLSIQGNSVASGGLGGSRQGVAQGVAAGKAADSLQGNLAGLGGSMYQSALNAALSKYGTDTNFYGQQRGQDLQGSAQNQSFYTNQRNSDIAKAGQDQSFYSTNRQQDLAGAQLGGSLLGQSQSQAFGPLTSASGIYKPFSGLASSAGDSGTNWQGIAGGLLGGAQLAKNMGWW